MTSCRGRCDRHGDAPARPRRDRGRPRASRADAVSVVADYRPPPSPRRPGTPAARPAIRTRPPPCPGWRCGRGAPSAMSRTGEAPDTHRQASATPTDQPRIQRPKRVCQPSASFCSAPREAARSTRPIPACSWTRTGDCDLDWCWQMIRSSEVRQASRRSCSASLSCRRVLPDLGSVAGARLWCSSRAPGNWRYMHSVSPMCVTAKVT